LCVRAPLHSEEWFWELVEASERQRDLVCLIEHTMIAEAGEDERVFDVYLFISLQNFTVSVFLCVSGDVV
jgi:hypothetical protein